MHREKVCNFHLAFLVGVFNNPSPQKIISWHQEMQDILLAELISKFVVFLLLVPKFKNGSCIFLDHESRDSFNFDVLLFWDPTPRNKLFHILVLRKTCHSKLNTSYWVQKL